MGKRFTKKGERAVRKIKRSLKKHGRKGNPFAIATAQVKGARKKKKRKR